jgi:hypothetical protein
VGKGEVTYEDNLEEHLLIDLHELLVPLIDVGCLLARVGIIVVGGNWIPFVMLTPLDDLAEYDFVHL